MSWDTHRIPDQPHRTTVAAIGGRDHALIRKFRLVAGERVYESTGERTVIGTHETADLVLDDATVSRFHCELAIDDAGGVRVRDLGSRNGTIVQGVHVIEAYLANGDVLALGESRVRFELGHDVSQVLLSKADSFGDMVGRSPRMRAVFEVLGKVAASDATVLLEGETGTGKEVAAASVHTASARADKPLIVVDCSAIPADLLESELFGHEKGAFTGAVATREGAFEAADGGTLFLDEIGELPLDMQPKLLRVLEAREVKRVGATRPRAIDVRVVAATNRNLRQEVNAKRFRADLYYRLAVVRVELPALRDRLDDLPVLIEHLLGRMRKQDRPEAELVRAPAFVAELSQHAWPGNVRELRNYIERCLAMREALPVGEEATASEPPATGLQISAEAPFRETRDRFMSELERAYLIDLLARHTGNIAAASRHAGIDRAYLYRLLWKHGLK